MKRKLCRSCQKEIKKRRSYAKYCIVCAVERKRYNPRPNDNKLYKNLNDKAKDDFLEECRQRYMDG
jgi:hypothetical protein